MQLDWKKLYQIQINIFHKALIFRFIVDETIYDDIDMNIGIHNEETVWENMINTKELVVMKAFPFSYGNHLFQSNPYLSHIDSTN